MHDDVAVIEKHPSRLGQPFFVFDSKILFLQSVLDMIDDGPRAHGGRRAHDDEKFAETRVAAHFHHHDILGLATVSGFADQLDLTVGFDFSFPLFR